MVWHLCVEDTTIYLVTITIKSTKAIWSRLTTTLTLGNPSKQKMFLNLNLSNRFSKFTGFGTRLRAIVISWCYRWQQAHAAVRVLCNRCEIKAMGRNSKIRQQRKHSALIEISSGTQMPSHYLPRHPLYHKTFKQPSENILLGKIAASLKPFPKVGSINLAWTHTPSRKKIRFCGCEAGGLSAAGERTGGSKLWLFTSSNQYIPRQLLKKKCVNTVATEDIRAMDNMIEVYEPTNSVVMVYVNNDGEISHPCH